RARRLDQSEPRAQLAADRADGAPADVLDPAAADADGLLRGAPRRRLRAREQPHAASGLPADAGLESARPLPGADLRVPLSAARAVRRGARGAHEGGAVGGRLAV